MDRGFHRYHPATCMIYYIGYFILCMLLHHPLFLIASLIGIIIFNQLQDGGRQLRSYFVMYLVLALSILVLNPLFTRRGREILFYLWDQPVTLEAITSGWNMALSMLCILFGFVSFNLTITSGKFLYIYARFLPKSALVLMLAVRFVPLLKRRLYEISTVQRTKGVDVSTGRYWKRAKDGMLLLQTLLTWCLEEALQTADSMQSRGYGLVRQRTSYQRYLMRKEDYLLILQLSVLFILCAVGWSLGYGKLQIYPVLESIAFSSTEWWFFLAWIIYIVTPILIEGRDEWRWGSLSK
ncbi:energy-coupling factor transporter transmembrane component T [Ammoniphilus sp. CFH 90114]|uniref:energy-coupling factor transporter transmembrane component T n=1 Tax=Ammoniphilus sp. CFH 90114 TaxID=2493665 RepID=UPI0013E92107|nr:energy-coupling factor transporter transmembrane component T [Ammoniphilus sp. CFH 90114]